MIIIGGYEFATPIGFTPEPREIYKGGMVNGNGVEIKNYVKTNYDLDLEWEYMPQNILENLITSTTVSNVIEVTYQMPKGSVTKNFRRAQSVKSTLAKYNKIKDEYIWGKVNVKLEEI